MRMLGMRHTVSGAGSNTPSEEGFVSGSSADEPSYVDRLAIDLGSFAITSNHSQGFSLFDVQQHQKQNSLQHKYGSEGGASCGENDNGGILLVNDMPERMRSESVLAASVQHALNGPTQLPGSWFYEIGSDETSCSPVGEFNDEFRTALLLSARNVTESVGVPSSEHVAEIVGRQGCKIKALRAKTNTYIKTPVRGEEPIFVVTGRPDDVADAKREIECAAEHFTQIRASRRHSQGVVSAPGHVTAYVRVPLRVVGLVVGPKGATIKRIQQDTHTYIITPSREREPIFEVTGLPPNVEAARREIEQHIYQRTGNMPITDPTGSIQSYDLQGNVITSTGSVRPSSLSYGSLVQSVRSQSTVDALTNNSSFLSTDFHKTTDIPFGGLSGLSNQSGYGFSSSASPTPANCCTSNASSDSSTSIASSTIMIPRNGSQLTQQCAFQHISDADATVSLTLAHGHTSNIYQPWSAVYSTVGLDSERNTNDALSKDRYSDVFTSQPSLGSLLANMAGGSGVTTLTQQHSSSLSDEGLGGSPNFNSGNFGSDPYHLMMASIWSDLDGNREQASGGSVDTAVASA